MADVTPEGNDKKMLPLGFEGEYIAKGHLPGVDVLIVPVPGAGMNVLVVKDYLIKGKYSVITTHEEQHTDDLLMAAALVQEIINVTQSREAMAPPRGPEGT